MRLTMYIEGTVPTDNSAVTKTPKVIVNNPRVILITPKENKNSPREKCLDPYVAG